MTKTKFLYLMITLLTTFGVSATNKNHEDTSSYRKTGTSGDWGIMCQKTKSKKNKTCFLSQALQATADETQKSFTAAEYAIFKLPQKDKYKLAISLPSHFSPLLQKGATIVYNQQIHDTLEFITCNNSTCFASSEISKTEIEKIAKHEDVRIVFFSSPQGNQQNLNFSSKGLENGLKKLP